jgi:hypothetical protein
MFGANYISESEQNPPPTVRWSDEHQFLVSDFRWLTMTVLNTVGESWLQCSKECQVMKVKPITVCQFSFSAFLYVFHKQTLLLKFEVFKTDVSIYSILLSFKNLINKVSSVRFCTDKLMEGSKTSYGAHCKLYAATYLLIYGLFNNAASSSDYTMSNNTLINE